MSDHAPLPVSSRQVAGVPSPEASRWALRGVLVLLVVSVGACLAVGADRPAAPHFLPTASARGLAGPSSPRSLVPGFSQIGFRVIDRRGRIEPLRCALDADTPAARQQGLTGRADLDGYAAMLFRFYSNTSEPFDDKGVPIPVSVAWFDASGVLVGSADLSVCSVSCPTVAPFLPYKLAIEVPQGGLAQLGIGQGSVLLVGGNCAA